MLSHVVESDSPISDDHIQKFEERWSISLPPSYKAFLKRHNGGRPIPDAFYVTGFSANPEAVIQEFFGLNTELETSDLNWNLENLGVPQPEGVVPIASNGGGDYICIDTHSGNRIIYWDMLACWGKDTWQPKDFYFVAKDFDALLASLHEFQG